MKTIYILWLRQLKRYFRSRSRMFSSLGQPLLFLLALGFGFGPIYAKAGGGNYLQFIAPGIIAMSILFTSVFSGIEIIWDKQFGFLKETLVAPVSRFSIMIGRTLGGATVATIQGVIIFLFTLLFGFHPISIKLLPAAFLFIFMMSIFFTALGTAIASLMDDMQAFPFNYEFFDDAAIFSFGVAFSFSRPAEAFLIIASINPLSYGVDGLRGTLVSATHFGLWNDFGILILLTLLILAIGSYLFSKIEI